MKDVETIYVNMLGGSDVLATHSSAFSRQLMAQGNDPIGVTQCNFHSAKGQEKTFTSLFPWCM